MSTIIWTLLIWLLCGFAGFLVYIRQAELQKKDRKIELINHFNEGKIKNE